jgi:hypothetical protein
VQVSLYVLLGYIYGAVQKRKKKKNRERGGRRKEFKHKGRVKYRES